MKLVRQESQMGLSAVEIGVIENFRLMSEDAKTSVVKLVRLQAASEMTQRSQPKFHLVTGGAA